MISIIILAHNQQDLTYECIQAVLATTSDCEIILIDNGSDPAIKPPFSGFTDIRLIRNDENKGFPVAVNQGIREAKGDIICLLNNDVIVTPGSLNRLADYLNQFDIVGPVTNFCAGMQRVQVGGYGSIEGLNKEADANFAANKGGIEEVNFVIGFLMMFRKSLYDELGEFDESLWPCSGEELDFCWRSRSKGYKVGIAYDTYVHHEGSKAPDDLEMNEDFVYEQLLAAKNRLLIHQPGKNGDILICLPIARWYSDSYDIDWLCPEEYHINFRSIDYCRPVTMATGEYAKVIDLSFGLYESNIHTWWMKTRPRWQSFIIPKYILADVPLIQRWNLQWNRNIERENSLYDKIVAEVGPNYSLCHEVSDDGISYVAPVQNKAIFRPIEDYNIFDWYKVIMKAQSIHCIDSSLCNFVDVIPEALKIRKIYYRTAKVPNQWDRTLLTNNWEIK
jgi:GT2 family glycosyltransferase